MENYFQKHADISIFSKTFEEINVENLYQYQPHEVMMTETLQFLVNLYYFVTEMQTNGFNDEPLSEQTQK